MAKIRKSQFGSTGLLTFKPEPDQGLVAKSLDFVRKQLPEWRDDSKRPLDTSEKLLNSSLCDFLDTHSRAGCPMIRFKHEAPQTGRCTVGLGILGTEEMTSIGASRYTIYEPFMVVECKRLPTPGIREREYVAGTDKPSGGIQRFKLGLHGANVETAIIVAYIQKQTVRHWFKKINGWIQDRSTCKTVDSCVWSQSDVLHSLIVDELLRTSQALSNHSRTGPCRTVSIQLHHLWVVTSQ